MQESWIDADNAALLDEGRAEEILAHDPDAALIRVIEALMVQDFPKLIRPSDAKPARDYDRDDCIAHGHWLMALLREHYADDDKDPKLKLRYLRRLGQLGVGPGDGRIFDLWGGKLWAYADELGVKTSHPGRKYSSWVAADFERHADRLTRALGYKPIHTDYNHYADNLQGPDYQTIHVKVGGLRKLNERRGYLNVQEMDPEDMAHWGAQVLAANPGMRLTPYVVDALSRVKRGMSVRTIYNHFVSFKEFQNQAKEIYTAEAERRQETEVWLNETYEDLTNQGILQLPNDTDQIVKLRTTAKYILGGRLKPGLPKERLAALAVRRPFELIDAICDYDNEQNLTKADFEIVADRLGIFDYIWQLDDGLDRLRVTETMIDAVRRHRGKSRSHGLGV